jgi:hypothetical protein
VVTYDVVYATDLRSRGSDNRAIAEEVRAHALVGYRTGLHPLLGATTGAGLIEPGLRELLDDGLAELLLPGRPVTSCLLVVRGADTLGHEQPRPPRIEADRRLLIVDAADRALSGAAEHGHRPDLARSLGAAVGHGWGQRGAGLGFEVAATSRRLAVELAAVNPAVPLHDGPWTEVVDVDRWARRRDLDASPLVVGWHGADTSTGWPRDEDPLDGCLPADGMQVLVRPGAVFPRRVRRRLPSNWTVLDGDEPVARFLARQHVHTTLPFPSADRPAVRTIVEAMASGAVTVLPEDLHETVGDGPVYLAGADDAPVLYRGLAADRDRLGALAEAGQRAARERFHPDQHRQRLAAVLGPPRRRAGTASAVAGSASAGAGTAAVSARTAAAGARTVSAPALPRVLFLTDNGHGLGHLTRMLAVARRAQGRFTPVFLTLSAAYPVLHEHGICAEYSPSAPQLGLRRAPWQALFGPRLLATLRRVQPRLAVIDHVGPPDVLGAIRRDATGFETVWSRRGLWREGRNLARLDLARSFDHVVEPRDLAAPIDRGIAATRRRGLTSLPPITLFTPDELVDRAEARNALDLPPEGRAVLLQLSDSDPARLATLIAAAAAVVREVAGEDPVHLFAPQHVLHRDALDTIPGVRMRPVYPIARYLRAFDGAISTAGYNSFHELVASGVPAVFVARDSATLDDQRRRAEFAALCGRAGFAEAVGDADFRAAVARMLRPTEAAIAAEVTGELEAMDGAQAFADLVAERVAALVDQPLTFPEQLPANEGHLPALASMRSGWSLPAAAEPGAPRVVIVAVDHDEPALLALTDDVAALQQQRDVKPILLVSSASHPAACDAWGLQFETAATRDEWEALATDLRYEDYLRARVAELHAVYRPAAVVAAQPGRPVPEWLLP